MMSRNKYVIIVAGGKGLRFGAEMPKQFVLLKGLPVLMHTITRFNIAIPDGKIIVVLPFEQISYWQELCQKYNFTINHEIALAGETRYHSVKNGLDKITIDNGIVAIHDGVRPLVSEKVICESYEVALTSDSAIPVIPITDSVRMIDKDTQSSHSLERSTLRAVQTPQTFNLAKLKAAYSEGFSELFTDDASVLESLGEKITLFSGDINNIKITHPRDIKFAEYILENE